MTQKTCSNHLVPLKLLSESESKKSKGTKKKNQRMKNHWRRKINTSTTQDQMFYTVKYLNNKVNVLRWLNALYFSNIVIEIDWFKAKKSSELIHRKF